MHYSEECEKVLMIADLEVGDMDTFSIYTPLCTATFSRLSHLWRSKTYVFTSFTFSSNIIIFGLLIVFIFLSYRRLVFSENHTIHAQRIIRFNTSISLRLKTLFMFVAKSPLGRLTGMQTTRFSF